MLCALVLPSAPQTRPAPQTPPAPRQLLGRISFPNSGLPAAQAPFIRGVLLMHSFEYDDAIAAFRDAERIDPGFALAYWGEALSYDQPLWYNEDVAKARAALGRLAPTRAGRQAKAVTPREKLYLDAVERLFGDGDKAVRDRGYSARMGELHAQFPDDDEAAVLYALSLLALIPPDGRDTTLSLKAGGIAMEVLARNPQHPGAAHYALHAFDDGEHAAMGLQAARTYARFAPASSHARHMPSHVFLPLGMWDEAVASDESAFAASVDLAKRKGLTASQYDFHSLSWLQYEYLQQGRFSKAKETMRTVEGALGSQGAQGAQGARGARGSRGAAGGRSANPVNPVNPENPEHPENHENPGHVESEIGKGYSETSLKSELASMKARLVMESGDWSLMKSQANFENIDELFALGVASVPLNDPGRADAALENLRNAGRTVPDADARAVALIMADELDGLTKLAKGDRAGSLASLSRAAQAEARRPKPIARPYPIKPAGELYAEILLGTGDAAGAVRQFKAALARTPRRAASLLGLARAASVSGQRADAAAAAKEFLAVWHLADPDRPELAEMRALAR